MKLRAQNYERGFTLLEMMIATAMVVIVALAGYLLMSSSSVLLAENLSLNHGNTTVRGALDRLSGEMNQSIQSNTMPLLVNGDSSLYAGTASASGVMFDKYVGGPYVVNYQTSGSTNIAAGATSFTLVCSQSSLTSPPKPSVNDVVVLQSDTSQRPLVTAVSSSTSGTNSVYTVTVTPAFANAMTFTSGMFETAYLIHREAVIVASAGTGYEMRLYPSAENLSSFNYTNASSYTVLTSDIGKNSGDNTPFSLVTQNSVSFLNVAMRVEDQLYNTYLASRQANQFNTFLRADSMMRPRNTM